MCNSVYHVNRQKSKNVGEVAKKESCINGYNMAKQEMLLFVEHMDLWVVCNYIHTLYTLIMHHDLLPRKRLASFVQSHAYIFGVSQIGNQPLYTIVVLSLTGFVSSMSSY